MHDSTRANTSMPSGFSSSTVMWRTVSRDSATAISAIHAAASPARRRAIANRMVSAATPKTANSTWSASYHWAGVTSPNGFHSETHRNVTGRRSRCGKEWRSMKWSAPRAWRQPSTDHVRWRSAA